MINQNINISESKEICADERHGTSEFQKPSIAQFRRRASAVPNLILIRFDCSTAGKQLWFSRRAKVEPNSGFTDAS